MLTYNMDVTPESVWKRTTPSEAELTQPYYCTEAGVFYAQQHFATIAKYLVFWLVYYIALSVATNGFNFVQLGKSNWLSTLVQMFFVFIGPEIMIGVQYITFYNKGFLWSELTHLGGSITGIWLYPIVFMLPLAVFVCSKIYKKSKNPYIGGIIMGILACVVSVTNTLTLG